MLKYRFLGVLFKFFLNYKRAFIEGVLKIFVVLSGFKAFVPSFDYNLGFLSVMSDLLVVFTQDIFPISFLDSQS